jgi:hypothetical protein
LEATVIPIKNETDYIAQYHNGVKQPMGKIKNRLKVKGLEIRCKVHRKCLAVGTRGWGLGKDLV